MIVDEYETCRLSFECQGHHLPRVDGTSRKGPLEKILIINQFVFSIEAEDLENFSFQVPHGVKEIVENFPRGSKKTLPSCSIPEVSRGNLVDELQVKAVLLADPRYLCQLLHGCAQDAGKAVKLPQCLPRGHLQIASGGPQREKEFHHVLIGESFETALQESPAQPFPMALASLLQALSVHNNNPTTILIIPSFRRVTPVKTGAESSHSCEESEELDSLPILRLLDAPG